MLLTWRQGQAETEQVIKVGLKLFHELGERNRKTEAEVQAYREALTQVATRAGIELPVFLQDTGDGGEFNAQQMREWLSGFLEGKTGGGRGRGGGSRSRGRGEGRTGGGRVTKRLRGVEEGEGTEGRRAHT